MGKLKFFKTNLLRRNVKLSGDGRNMLYNILGAFGVRGGALIVSVFSMPVYTHFFPNQRALGVWYTLLAVLNWVLTFDLGLGNGLRNKLPLAMARHDKESVREYIAATYFGTLGVVAVVGAVGIVVVPRIAWTEVINIQRINVSNEILIKCVSILLCGILLQFIFKLVTSILFAFQRSAMVNLLALMTSILTLVLIVVAPSGTNEQNLIRMSVINAIAANVPYIVATIIMFSGPLKGYFPQKRNVKSKRVREVLNIGVTLLVLQLVFMVISSTNELLISRLTDSAKVVDYQAYNKIFNTISSLFTLALSPVWSAVTKAAGEKNYQWIKKLNKILLMVSGVVLVSELCLVPFLQRIIDIWLGRGYVTVVPMVSVLFVAFNVLLFVHNVNTSFGNGMSYFKVQIVWMIIAAVVDIPLAILFVNILNSWIGVIVANFLALLPYEIIEIIAFRNHISSLQAES